MKFKKIAAIIVICHLFLGNIASAQQNTSPSGGDDKKLKLFFEKTYLHTDRDYYSGGENLWFSAYLVNGKSANLTSTSNNLYVELISPKSEILDRKIIRLDKGLGHGDFELKDSLPSGYYQLRAYTNWMRNFGDDFVFQKKIYIASPIASNVKKSPAAPKNSINFFPEGGSLVEGITSIVAFKTEDENGNGLKVSGKIISNAGDTVATFQGAETGLGIFTFMPIAGQQYKIEGTFGNGQKMVSTLPKALSKGISMHVTADSLSIKVAVSINEPMFVDLNSKPLTVVVKHAGDNVYSGSINVTKPGLIIPIPLKDLPPGIAIITLLDHQGKPNCERLVFIQNNNPVKLSLTINKAVYKSREKVDLTIKATDASGKPLQTTLSLAAVDELIPKNTSNIVSYLMLQSEVKGQIKDIEKYFDPSNPSRFKQLELLLLTQGWRDYVWKKLADSALRISFMPEPGFTLAGLVRQKLANKPMPNMNITLFGTGFNGSKMYASRTDAQGRFFFDGISWNGNQAIKLSSRDDKGKKAGWLILDSIFKSPLPVAFTYKFNPNESTDAAYNTEMETRKAYNRTYKTGDEINLNSINVVAPKGKRVEMFNESLSTFGYPDQVFDITDKDYSYKGLEHFLLTKVKGSQATEDTDTVGSDGVTFITNGKKVRPRITVNNREELVTERLDYYSLTMDQINQITVRHLVNQDGNDVYVIALNLKDSALRGPNLDLLNANVMGYYNARTFYVPNPAERPLSSKDLRTTIYWLPLVKTNALGVATLSFYNADPKASISISAQGITSTGVPVASKLSYKVQ